MPPPLKLSLQQAITTCELSPSSKLKLQAVLWRTSSSKCSKSGDIPFEAYMSYYAQQCDSFIVEQESAVQSGEMGHICSHLDLLNVTQQVLIGIQEPRSIIHGRLRDQASLQIAGGNGSLALPADTTIENSINWAVRMTTMLEVGELKCAFSQTRPLLWEDGSLKDFIQQMFVPTTATIGQVRLEKTFNAANLERIAGISIEWTNDLASHLSLRDDDKKVLVFHHASFLRHAHPQDDIFPQGFRQETLQTLALLFPKGDRATRKWFRTQRAFDTGLLECHRLRADDRRIEKFSFWQERLSILKQVFDESEPKTLSQWWFDRRKGPQWYTFWVAIVVLTLTVFFGTVQSVIAALQLYKDW